MRIHPARRALAALCLVPAIATGAAAGQSVDPEIESLREAVRALRVDYEARLAALEQRLALAERKAERQIAPQVETLSDLRRSPGPGAAPPGGTGQAAFNPAIGVIFQGTAWDYRHDPDNYRIPGYPLGGEAGPISEGLALGETELDISASVDDKFTAWLTLPVVIEDGEARVEIEEAWIETTALPAGFAARMGRFFSGIGYLNGRHSHTWDFADQPLPYQAMLGSQYLDDGLQVRWLAPTAIYLELGAELLRGGRYPASGAQRSGLGGHSLFANLGGDIGDSSSWLAGVSYLHSRSAARPSAIPDDGLLFDGESDIGIAHLVWKWAPHGNWKQRNLIVQSEFIWRGEDGAYTPSGGAPLAFDDNQRGWYLQAVYQPIPRWRFGGRVDGLSSADPGAAFDATALAGANNDPRRYSLMADWSNSEFSRLRLQYTRDRSGVRDNDQWGLQYIHSIGAHGAHTF